MHPSSDPAFSGCPSGREALQPCVRLAPISPEENPIGIILEALHALARCQRPDHACAPECGEQTRELRPRQEKFWTHRMGAGYRFHSTKYVGLDFPLLVISLTVRTFRSQVQTILFGPAFLLGTTLGTVAHAVSTARLGHPPQDIDRRFVRSWQRKPSCQRR